ncbi:hypothetical protein TTRE_0000781401 [Trichuris trichiura]|uniref:Uncharacterized protein n=1 Tax=Trichuris trichiura TaxID=36087 RepID=A0A077ZI41_TRITR|nr:hypothetical protein TTRE_0000781401 [Trichuris trichiura]
MVRTIGMGNSENNLCGNGGILLMVATELCFLTVACSVVNVEQLRRENGLQVRNEAMQNKLARLSCEALASLAGFKPGCLPNNVAVSAFTKLLTPYICDLLETNSYSEILKQLGNFCETPRFIWNSNMKSELLDYVIKAPDLLMKAESPDDSGFRFSYLEEEFCLGDVYVRIYNRQPKYILKDPRNFFMELLDYLGKSSVETERLDVAAEALLNVLNNYPGLEVQCIAHLNVLLRLLELELCEELCSKVLMILRSVLANEDCCGTFLLKLFCCHETLSVRENAGYLLVKLQSDPLHGPRWTRFVGNFMPPVFADMMREALEDSINLFDSQTETPELIWNKQMRMSVCQSVCEMEQLFLESLKSHGDKWALPSDFQTPYQYSLSDELIIGGISLRLFISNPAWKLRAPKKFLIDLLNTLLQDCRSESIDESRLQILDKALALLLHCHPGLCDAVATHGYIPHIVETLSSAINPALRSSLLILCQIVKSQLCVNKMAATECVSHLASALHSVPEMQHVICRTLSALFEHGTSSLVADAIKCNLHIRLLELLASDLPATESPSAVKAEIVKTLNCMAACELFGQEVASVLEKSSVWGEFKDQKHDLFISCPSQMRFLPSMKLCCANFS